MEIILGTVGYIQLHGLFIVVVLSMGEVITSP